MNYTVAAQCHGQRKNSNYLHFTLHTFQALHRAELQLPVVLLYLSNLLEISRPPIGPKDF